VPAQPKQPTAKGPAEWFTGDVFIDAIARGEDPARVRVSAVRFTPAARTAWHAHAVGQTLYVTEGKGLVQSRGAPSRRSAPVTSSRRRPASGTGTAPLPTAS
jgi:quercetin dioxygenase-like cupin family protein